MIQARQGDCQRIILTVSLASLLQCYRNCPSVAANNVVFSAPQTLPQRRHSLYVFVISFGW